MSGTVRIPSNSSRRFEQMRPVAKRIKLQSNTANGWVLTRTPFHHEDEAAREERPCGGRARNAFILVEPYAALPADLAPPIASCAETVERVPVHFSTWPIPRVCRSEYFRRRRRGP